MVVNSRIDKYRDLRAGLKDEAGINRDNMAEVIATVEVDEEDDFLTSVNRLFEQPKKKKRIEDTLIEAKTFEQMRQENSEEINRALRSAKVSVGKEAQYNTRMDILNKIRESEKEVIRLDNLDNVETSQFSKGYFVNGDKENEEVDEVPVINKKKMTLMERLASMSPVEDAKKAKLVLDETEENKEAEEIEKEATVSEQTDSLEDMIRQIKEKDQREVEKALKEKEATDNIKLTKNEIEEQTNNDKPEEIGSREEVVEEKKKDRMVSVLNYIIVFLVIVFIGLCGMIGYQLFF